MQTIEETYRLVDLTDPTRERGLIEIATTLTAGAPLYSHSIRVLALGDAGLPSGDYRLEFVKKLHTDDLYRRIQRSFNQLAGSNDRGTR